MKYIYPENLSAKPRMWLWNLKDLAVASMFALVGVFFLAQFKIALPLVLAALYAFVTIRLDDDSIMDFLQSACTYFFLQRRFCWSKEPETVNTAQTKGNTDEKQ